MNQQTTNLMPSHFDLSPSATERAMQREETIDTICQRYGLSEDTARRLVAVARTPDQALSMAELMR